MIAHGNLQCKKTDFEHPPQTSHSPTHRTIWSNTATNSTGGTWEIKSQKVGNRLKYNNLA